MFGLSGSGKTRLTRSLLRHHSRCLVVDPLKEYGDVTTPVGNLVGFAQHLKKTGAKKWRVSLSHDRLEEEFPLICEVAYKMGNCILVVDEADMFCDPTSIPLEFAKLIKYGRHNQAYYLIVARRPSEVHRLPTSQAWELYTFAQHEPRDLDYFSKYAGKEMSEGLSTLPYGTYRTRNLRNRLSPVQDVALP